MNRKIMYSTMILIFLTIVDIYASDSGVALQVREDFDCSKADLIRQESQGRSFINKEWLQGYSLILAGNMLLIPKATVSDDSEVLEHGYDADDEESNEPTPKASQVSSFVSYTASGRGLKLVKREEAGLDLLGTENHGHTV